MKSTDLHYTNRSTQAAPCVWICMSHIRRRLFDQLRPQMSSCFKCALQRKSLFVEVELCISLRLRGCVCVCSSEAHSRVPTVDTEGLSCSPQWRWFGNSSRQPLGTASCSFYFIFVSSHIRKCGLMRECMYVCGCPRLQLQLLCLD